ncbi:MAG: ParB N-terminal domain-containing protein [Oscillospiraceae bacterium]|nr:ParB N-terminal domain-containing protein [Oscillospiraceae bacterium]
MPNEKPIPQQIPIEKIHDLPGVTDFKLPEKSYGTLVSSILVNGLREPVLLRQLENGEYQLVHGYRRRKAAELAKLKTLDALVYDMTEKEAKDYRIAVAANPEAPIPGKLIAPDTKAPPKAEKAAEEKTATAEKKAEDKQSAKAAEPQEKKAAPAEKKAEAAVPSAAKPEEKKAAEPPKDDKIVPEAPAPAAADKEKKPAPAKAPAKKAEKEEKPVGTVAEGPTGTAITKLLGEKLSPPTEKDKKALPIPGEGEAFSAILHPAYLKKADINTFSVDRDSDDFKELYQSIKRFGVKDPVLARFNKDGELEILSGQRRHLIASELNYPVPTIIQQLDDDDARILVADGNLHREHISTYDLSRALRMKADSMKRKAGRKIRGAKSGPETDEIIAKEMGMSTMKLNRLMKLSEATRSICDLVDEGRLPTSVAYNIAFLQPKHQDTVADLIGINVKVNNENTGILKKVASAESLTEQKIRDVLEGKYPPKVVEKPKPVAPPVPSAQPIAPASVSKSPDISVPPVPPAQPKAADNVVPFPSTGTAPTQAAPSTTPGKEAAPTAPATVPTKPAAEPQDRENSYETKIVLRGDRLRKYFPDVSMTPREIEDSVYDALEMRRQMQEKAKQKAEIFSKDKKGPVK